MHIPQIPISLVQGMWKICHRVPALLASQLRRRGLELAKGAPTACVIRGSRIPLRWYQRPLARALEREGHGTVRDGCYETWVNVTPPGVLMAAQMRDMFSPRHRDWE